MSLTGLRENALKLILFGGKGGVGKTTCASSAGLFLASDSKALLISTDPAHSLSDSLGQKIGDQIRAVRNVKCAGGQGETPDGSKTADAIENLSALEISAEKAFSSFKAKYETEIKKILDTSTYLDQEDINSVLALPIPGMDEVMGFKTIVDLIEKGEFSKYIVDTAPTGHALRLLTLPGLLDDWIKVMAKMRWKYRYMVESFGGKYSPDEADDLLLSMKRTVKRIEDLLRDSERCEFVAVTIPEDMALSETGRLMNSLSRYGMAVKQLVVNNVVEPGDCGFCRARRKAQEYYINKIKRMFGHLKITMIPLQPQEVKGIEALNNFKELLF